MSNLNDLRDVCAVILAAGEGNGMRSQRAKVLHSILGRPMVQYSVDLCLRLGVKRVLVVVGSQAEQVKEVLAGRPVEFVHQREPRGTAHAVLQTELVLSGAEGTVLVLPGDMPLLTDETVRRLVEVQAATRTAATLLTAELKNPTGYGRIIRDHQGRLRRIVEEVEATEKEKVINEINAGVYCFRGSVLFEALKYVKVSRVKGEFFLPEVMQIFIEQGQPIYTLQAPDPSEALGVNTRIEMAEAAAVLRQRVQKRLMEAGVTLLDPQATYIDDTVTIGPETVIYPGVTLQGATTVGAGCVIYPHCRIQDSHLADGITILDGSVILGSDVAEGCVIGPYAHLRPQSRLKAKAKVGNFCEVKKAVIGPGSKVPHLAYIGDASLGERVNIGAGTITCNYDGFAKHETVIEDEVFVGSNTNLVAPVKVGKGAIIAAGSTITEAVPPEAVAFGRAPQVNKEGRAATTRKMLEERAQSREWRAESKQSEIAGGKKWRYASSE
ncbi:MAG: bifunctional UDP-N-acetylglucosamine diphosphorylase/glucosamine-1-phosphate N-acetyltransferase GlmU [candidate division NC10 bacterium]|nr:bifunctional UDP-N-acetylglucosamine diphosphorylase/glucosamine-1-phosphate N-acetyltransferase GlmU [candidate division NC10 bacterium]